MIDHDTTSDDMVTTAQHRLMHKLWREAGTVDRTTRLQVTSAMLGRLVESSSTLSRRDAAALIVLARPLFAKFQLPAPHGCDLAWVSENMTHSRKILLSTAAGALALAISFGAQLHVPATSTGAAPAHVSPPPSPSPSPPPSAPATAQVPVYAPDYNPGADGGGGGGGGG